MQLSNLLENAKVFTLLSNAFPARRAVDHIHTSQKSLKRTLPNLLPLKSLASRSALKLLRRLQWILMATSTAGMKKTMSLVRILVSVFKFLFRSCLLLGIVDASPLSMPSAVPTAWLGYPVCTYIVDKPSYDDKGYQVRRLYSCLHSV